MTARSPRYWLTTHWPLPADQSIARYLYLKPAYRSPKREVAAGDAVLFYESKSRAPAGLYEPRPRGKGGIVAVAEVGGAWRPKKSRNDRDEWTLEAVCVYQQSAGFLAREELCRIMNWSPRYYMRGLGGGSGILEISADEFRKVSAAFFAVRN